MKTINFENWILVQRIMFFSYFLILYIGMFITTNLFEKIIIVFIMPILFYFHMKQDNKQLKSIKNNQSKFT